MKDAKKLFVTALALTGIASAFAADAVLQGAPCAPMYQRYARRTLQAVSLPTH